MRPFPVAEATSAYRSLELTFPVFVSMEEESGRALIAPIAAMPLRLEGSRRLSDEVGRLVVGRGVGCDIVADDATASRQHATLVRRKLDRWSIIDEASSNGTFADGRRLRARTPQELAPGTVVRFGDSLRFAFLDEPNFLVWDAERSRTAFRPRARHRGQRTSKILAALDSFDAVSWIVALDEALVEEFDSRAALDAFIERNAARVVAVHAKNSAGREVVFDRESDPRNTTAASGERSPLRFVNRLDIQGRW